MAFGILVFSPEVVLNVQHSCSRFEDGGCFHSLQFFHVLLLADPNSMWYLFATSFAILSIVCISFGSIVIASFGVDCGTWRILFMMLFMIVCIFWLSFGVVVLLSAP